MNTRTTQFRTNRRGLTLAELIAGLAVTGVVAAAVAAFSTATATGWNASKQSSSLGATATRSGTQFEQAVRTCLTIAQTKQPTVSSASSYAFLWRFDGLGGTEDGVAQAGEMALIEYDPTNDTVWLYAPLDEADMTSGQFTNANVSSLGSLSEATLVDTFKNGSYLGTRRALIGPGTSTTSAVPRVVAATFTHLAPAGGKPLLNYVITLEPARNSGDTSERRTINGTITLRSPQTPTNAGG